jgi:hypothetical protein
VRDAEEGGSADGDEKGVGDVDDEGKRMAGVDAADEEARGIIAFRAVVEVPAHTCTHAVNTYKHIHVHTRIV